MLFISIDPGRVNTCIVVAYADSECQFVSIDSVFIVETSGLNSTGAEKLLEVLHVYYQTLDAVIIVEDQVAAIRGKSNLNIVYNNFVQAIIVGYFIETHLLVESSPNNSLRYLTQNHRVLPTDDKTIMATRLVDQLEAIWSDKVALFVKQHPSSVPHVMDCIAQMIFEILVNRIFDQV